jgi:hypothetical protein
MVAKRKGRDGNMHYFKPSEITEIMNRVSEALQRADKYGLSAEVISFALIYLKENPDRSISEALNYGFNEWVK